MTVPKLRGVIRRRILVNFRVDPEVLQRVLPAPFVPKLLHGWGVAGICLIRLEQIRPRRLPGFLGISSENAAHRVAVRWGGDQEGVYIARRDTSSLVNHLTGGRVFPGEHHRARFDVRDDDRGISLAMRARDGAVTIALDAKPAAALPATSRFGSLAEASAFFERGSLGYSATARGDHLDGMVLATRTWKVVPLDVREVHSSWFSDAARFPPGSVELDCALLMRDVDHEWIAAPELAIPHS